MYVISTSADLLSHMTHKTNNIEKYGVLYNVYQFLKSFPSLYYNSNYTSIIPYNTYLLF